MIMFQVSKLLVESKSHKLLGTFLCCPFAAVACFVCWLEAAGYLAAFPVPGLICTAGPAARELWPQWLLSCQGKTYPCALPALKPCLLPAGPFISVVLSKLENMLENSLHVNLLLIGIITQLASYPQPLLRSFLLNTNMVFQPSVRSLYQVCQPSPRTCQFDGC